ncbi:hypothetical protein EZS27_033525, partial [termite gut metagenome]
MIFVQNIKLLTQFSQVYGFKNVEFVNKDFYILDVLKILSTVKPDFCDFIFTGGTCMAKAYGLIERMSEDIDIKVSFKNKSYNTAILRKDLSKLKQLVTSSLKKQFPNIKEENTRAEN